MVLEAANGQKRDVDKYMFDALMNKVYSIYMPYIKICIVFLFILGVFCIQVYTLFGANKTIFGKKFVNAGIFLGGYAVVIMILITLFPKVVRIVPSCTIFVVIFTGSYVSRAENEFWPSEWITTATCLVYDIAISVPHMHMEIKGTYIFALAVHFVIIYNSFEEFQLSLLTSYVCNIIFLLLGTKLLYGNFKVVYETMLNNEQLANEMKKLLEMFPEGVIINNNSNHFWANKQFERFICDAKNSINKLKMHKVNMQHSKLHAKADEMLYDCKNLHDLIDQQCVYSDVDLNGEIQNVEIEGIKHVERIHKLKHHDAHILKEVKRFCIKTQKINWEGSSNSFMHVFIDMTDIIKLEDANNNARCQKLMLASASHEFRTPLNSILNSIIFMKSSYNTMCKSLKLALKHTGKYDQI